MKAEIIKTASGILDSMHKTGECKSTFLYTGAVCFADQDRRDGSCDRARGGADGFKTINIIMKI